MPARNPFDHIRVIRGDITRQRAAAIVNAANTTLLGGGGVDGAIHRSAGSDLLAECRTLGGCPTGEARISGGHRLPAKHVIHTVGPVWGGGDQGEDDSLASCYRNSLELAARNGIRTLCFPSISTGVYGFPVDRAARIAIREIAEHLRSHSLPETVTMVCFSARDLDVYTAAMSHASREVP